MERIRALIDKLKKQSEEDLDVDGPFEKRSEMLRTTTELLQELTKASPSLSIPLALQPATQPVASSQPSPAARSSAPSKITVVMPAGISPETFRQYAPRPEPEHSETHPVEVRETTKPGELRKTDAGMFGESARNEVVPVKETEVTPENNASQRSANQRPANQLPASQLPGGQNPLPVAADQKIPATGEEPYASIKTDPVSHLHVQEDGLVDLRYDPLKEIPTLSQQFSAPDQAPESLNDKLKQARTELVEVYKDTPVKDLRKAIGINDRFSFINELFRGDEAMYERSVKTINGFNIFPEAEYWIIRELKTKLGWNPDSGTVAQFDQLVRRRFS